MSRETDLTLEQASELLLSGLSPIARAETLPLLDALGRICLNQFFAVSDQPPFDRSPLDGYAAWHVDLAGATPKRPVLLRVVARTFAGDPPAAAVHSGEAVRIMTGAPIPSGATCVIRQEETDGGEETVAIYGPKAEHENICDRGEDVCAGRPLVQSGMRLTPAHLGVLAGQGVSEIEVFARPRVGVLSTGNELLPPGAPQSPGKIYDSNGIYFMGRLRELGFDLVKGDNGADNPQMLCRSIQQLLEECDAVVTTGGVSVGQHDYMPLVGERLGAQQLFHGIRVKPGAPALALMVGGKPVICLSGNPYAAAATLEVIARPALQRLAGVAFPMLSHRAGTLQSPFSKASPGRRLVRARVEGEKVFPAQGNHVSGALASLIGCNCLIDIPEGTPALDAGSRVELILL